MAVFTRHSSRTTVQRGQDTYSHETSTLHVEVPEMVQLVELFCWLVVWFVTSIL